MRKFLLATSISIATTVSTLSADSELKSPIIRVTDPIGTTRGTRFVIEKVETVTKDLKESEGLHPHMIDVNLWVKKEIYLDRVKVISEEFKDNDARQILENEISEFAISCSHTSGPQSMSGPKTSSEENSVIDEFPPQIEAAENEEEKSKSTISDKRSLRRQNSEPVPALLPELELNRSNSQTLSIPKSTANRQLHVIEIIDGHKAREVLLDHNKARDLNLGKIFEE
eukprot:GHVP01021162.1.p2 GENE.GHVP01021162.1~~GHVP01021162.1.p2  ORF type:complete len:227 (-),score=47.43 GHVP01021162.1:617-1297(-)